MIETNAAGMAAGDCVPEGKSGDLMARRALPFVRMRKKDPAVFVPSYETEGAAGMDIRAFTGGDIVIPPGERARIPTGLFIEIPPGFEAQVRPRSGLADRFGVTVLNAPGTIDSDYRGEVQVILINLGSADFIVKNGERIAQMVIAPVIKVEIAEETGRLSETKRGGGGFGSTGV